MNTTYIVGLFVHWWPKKVPSGVLGSNFTFKIMLIRDGLARDLINRMEQYEPGSNNLSGDA